LQLHRGTGPRPVQIPVDGPEPGQLQPVRRQNARRAVRKAEPTADREERRRHIRDFEKRLLDEEAHYIYTLQWHRIVPHSARVRGWTITPSHFLNNQLDTVWLAE